MEENLHFKIHWPSLIGQFSKYKPPGRLYLEGRFNGGFFTLPVWGSYMDGLIFGILRYFIFSSLALCPRFSQLRRSPLMRALISRAHILRCLKRKIDYLYLLSKKLVGYVVPGVVVYLTFTFMYGRGIITHSFITYKLHLKQSGKVSQPVL